MKAERGLLFVAGVLGGLLLACTSDPPSNFGGAWAGSGNGSGGDGNVTTSGPLPETAADTFTQVVYGQLMTSCGSCHNRDVVGVGTPYFLDDVATDAYTLVKGLPGYVTDPATSRLILKPVHYGGQGPALSTEQKELVTAWLNQELTENPGGTGDPGTLTPLQELETFGQCMSFDDFVNLNVRALSDEQAIYQNNSVECDSCHDDGQSGTLISAEEVEFFEGTKLMPYILKFAAVTLNEDGTFKDIARSNRWVEKCVEEQLVGNPHPECQNGQIAEEVVNSINSYFDLTYERWAADECDLATQPPPPQ
jgi:hypothetical protein